MNKKIISSIVVVVVIILGIWTFQNKSVGDKEIIKIGVVAPVTGSASNFGSTFVKAVEMAAVDISKQDTKYEYRIVVEDDESTSAKAASAASKLINVDKVQAILSTTGSTGNAAKSIAEKAGIIHIANTKDSSIANAPYNFTNLMLPEEDVKAWVSEAIRRGNKTVAVLPQIYSGSAAMVNALIPEADKQGLKIVFNESFSGDSRDFRTIVAKAKQTKADIYYVVAYPPSLDLVTRELISAGVKNIGAPTITASPEPSLYNGLWYTDCAVNDLAFKKRFEDLNPGMRFNVVTVPYGYDSFNMLVQSFEKGGDAYANLKAITEYNGKVGKVTKDANSQNFRSAASIWTMVNGAPEMVR